MTELTEQDVAVLNKIANKLGSNDWKRYVTDWLPFDMALRQTIRLVEYVAIEARLAEADKWKKEIDELIISCNTEILEAQKHLSKPTDIRSIEEAEDVIFWVGGFRKSLVDLKVRLGGKKE